MFRVEIVGQRIHLATDQYTSNLKTAVPGASFSKTAKRWTFPLTMDVCRDLRTTFGAKLQIGPQLADWARRAIALEQSQAEIGRSLEGVGLSRLPEVEPALAALLMSRPYQTSGALFIANGRRVLVADTPGLGKTTEAIAGIVESGMPGPYLVVAPKTSLDVVWEREIRARLPRALPVVLQGSVANREVCLRAALDRAPAALRDTWIITNIEMIRAKSYYVCPTCETEWPKTDYPKSQVIDCGHNPDRVKTRNEYVSPSLFEREWGAIVMDECQRSLLRTSGKPTQQRAGAKLLPLAEGGLRIALSGTPMRGKPQRLWGTLNWLREESYRSYWQYVERFWVVTQEGYGGARTIGAFREERADAFGAALDGIMIRRTKAEVSPELPAKQYMSNAPSDLPPAIWLPLDSKQEKAYRDMQAMANTEVEGGTLNAVGILAEMTRLKQFANSYGRMVKRSETFADFGNGEVSLYAQEDFLPALPSNKWEWTLQFLTERNIIPGKGKEPDADEEPTDKVIIVSQFTSILDMIYGELIGLKVPVRRVTGNITGRKRTEAIDAFNDPESGVQVMLLNTTAGGVAVTLDVADDMILFDETHVPDDQEQVEDRINNRNPESKVVPRRYWYLKSLGTIDEGIARTNLARDEDQRAQLDGRRGVEYLRQVVETTKGLK
jgi:SNF2 family DNA or RNA helicase